MSSYTTKEINVEELYLDEINPRFIIPPNPSQQSIVDYLVENEEVEKLAINIAKSGGLYAGERIIVTEDKGRWIVLEGNRRVCACKILLNPYLLVNKKPASVDKIELLMNSDLKENISRLNVDIMKNRLVAQSSLAAKHIDGIRRWSTISKYKFFVLEFDAGKSIEEISMLTGLSAAKIKSGLKEYRIIDYVLKLPFWTQEERDKYLNLQDIKTTRLTRLFRTKPNGTNNKKLKEIIDLDFDDKYLIKSSLNRDVFNEIMYIIAQAAFIPNYASNFNGTRSTYEDIPQLLKFFEQNELIIENKIKKTDSKSEDINLINSKELINNNKRTDDNANNNKQTDDNANNNKQYTSKRNVLIPEDFKVDCMVIKINDIINELKRLSLNYCVNAQAVLLRVLLELSLKYYLHRVNESHKIDEGHLEGTYVAAIESMRVKKLLNPVEHSNLIQLKKKDKIFNIFNGYVHYDTVVPSKEVLIYYFDNLRYLIEICLNNE